MKWPRIFGLILIVISVGMIIWGWYAMPRLVVGEVPMTPPPSASSTSTAPAVTAPVPTTTPTDAPLPYTAVPAPVMADINSTPVHVAIIQDGQELAAANVGLTQLNAKGELDPPSGEVGWYGPPEWDTVPGNLSDHPAILAGHVTYSGQPDVFYRLSEARAGDTVVVTYASGQVATFELDADPVSVSKNAVVDERDDDYGWVWQLDEPGRKLSLFTCDPGSGRDISGRSHNNWVVQATRIE